MQIGNNQILFVCMLSILFLASCGNKDSNEVKSSPSQIVAKVNGDEISIHQVNFELNRLGQLNEEQSKAASREILSRLVDQQLLKAKALETKLDRDPAVVQTLEAMKNQILAQAYLEKKISGLSKPATAEIDTFYKDHPELFEARRIFRLQELSIITTKDKYSMIEEGVKSLESINKVAEWLKDNSFPFSANSNVKPAEQIPLEILKKLQPMKDGEFFIFPTDKTVNIIHIAASKVEPVSREKATPIIEQFFLNQNKTKAVKLEVENLRKEAKVQYMGQFSSMEAPAKALQSDKADSKLGGQKQGASSNDASVNLDKGLSGL